MPDKKLTDNEIIKALECCSKPVGENCQECPLHLTDCLSVDIDGLALDLINRLQAENEKWQGGYMTQKQEIANLEIELKAMQGAANSYKAANERLKAENKLLIENDVSNKYPNCVLVEKGRIYTRTLEDYDELIGDISAEAYKEFAERLKLRFSGTLSCSGGVIARAVDNLLKELVGDK